MAKLETQQSATDAYVKDVDSFRKIVYKYIDGAVKQEDELLAKKQAELDKTEKSKVNFDFRGFKKELDEANSKLNTPPTAEVQEAKDKEASDNASNVAKNKEFESHKTEAHPTPTPVTPSPRKVSF